MSKRFFALLLVAGGLVGGASYAQGEAEATRGEAAAAKERLPIGMNLAPMSASNRELVFVDVMKMATRWFDAEEAKINGGRPRRARSDQGHGRGRGAGQRGGGAPARIPYTEVPVDEHGWPRPAADRGATAFVLRDLDGHYPGGTYVCTWKGTATISFTGPVRIARKGDHRLEVEVSPSRQQIALTVRDVDPTDPVHDIRFWMPGFEDAESPFNPDFVQRLRPFGVIRFWPWSKVNLAQGDWAQRATLESAIQTGVEGVAVEYMVDLCNELGATPWFCMPHLADDEFVRNFATIVRDRLRADLPMYVEFSNEVWNSLYPSCQWTRRIAKEEGVRAPEITAREAARDWRIWHEVFGDHKDRVIRVAAGHLHNPQVLRVMTEALGDEVDAIAIAAYFGLKPKEEGFGKDTTAAEILTAARRNLDGVVMERVRMHRNLADRLSERLGRKIAYVTYEGGPHIIARQTLTPGQMRLALPADAVSAAQDLPEMYEAYRSLLRQCREAGLELFCAYYFVGPRNSSDTFAHLSWLQQSLAEAPKFRALVEDWIE